MTGTRLCPFEYRQSVSRGGAATASLMPLVLLAFMLSGCGSGSAPSVLGSGASGLRGGVVGGSSGGTSGGSSGASGSGSGNTPITIGLTTTAAEPTTNGNSQLIFIPSATNPVVSDRSPTTGNGISLNQRFDDPTGGTASATFSGKLAGGTTVLGTGALNNAGTQPGNQQFYFASTNSNTIYASNVYDLFSATQLTDSRYGFVRISGTVANTPDAALGGFYTGNPTPVAQLPVQATYNGWLAGLQVTQGNSTLGALGGPISLTANFAQGTIAGSTANVPGYAPNTFANSNYGYDLSFNGRIASNTYTGAVAFTSPTGVQVPAAASSALNGGFFGATGAETAGAFRVEGQAPNASGNLTNVAVVGAFGAHR